MSRVLQRMCSSYSLQIKTDDESGGVVVDPKAKLEEELIIRPTSETVIWNTYKNWIQSYRDLPLLVTNGLMLLGGNENKTIS